MPKFGWCRFAEDKFGKHVRYHNLKFRMLSGVPLGTEIRRTIRKLKDDTTGAVTYRVRRGNGSYGSVAGKRYQDKYKYFVPGSINNPEGAAYRTLLTNAVDYWKNTLSGAQKKEYNRRATHGLKMSGYNLFVREVILGVFIIP